MSCRARKMLVSYRSAAVVKFFKSAHLYVAKLSWSYHVSSIPNTTLLSFSSNTALSSGIKVVMNVTRVEKCSSRSRCSRYRNYKCAAEFAPVQKFIIIVVIISNCIILTRCTWCERFMVVVVVVAVLAVVVVLLLLSPQVCCSVKWTTGESWRMWPALLLASSLASHWVGSQD